MYIHTASDDQKQNLDLPDTDSFWKVNSDITEGKNPQLDIKHRNKLAGHEVFKMYVMTSNIQQKHIFVIFKVTNTKSYRTKESLKYARRIKFL